LTNIPFYFELPAAMRIADLLEQDGKLQAAASIWSRLIALNPYDRVPREKLAGLAYKILNVATMPAGVDKSRKILRATGVSFPTSTLMDAYFDNLDQMFASKPRRSQPGRLILGIGCGRCGSTTLAGAMAGVPETCATHENPPPLFWEPLEDQLRVHIKRFRILTQYFAVVFDASHWWLNPLSRLFDEFPDLRVIGLWRETGACVQSFLNQKGSGRGSVNHWAQPGNGLWTSGPGDASLPSYPVPEGLAANPDLAKRMMVTRYVTDYNQALERMAATYARRVLLVRTEELGDEGTYARISSFVGFEVRKPGESLNVGGAVDSEKVEWNF